MENSRKKQFLSFKSCAVLSSVMSSQVVPLHPARDVNHPFVQSALAVYAVLPSVTQQLSWLSDPLSPCHSACVRGALVLLNYGPKAQNLDVPKSRHKVLPLSEKVSMYRKHTQHIQVLVLSVVSGFCT